MLTGTVVSRANGMEAHVSVICFAENMKHYMVAPADYCKAQRRYVKQQLRRVRPEARFVCELQVIDIRLADLKNAKEA